MNAWSKWLDYWLQKLKPFVKNFVKDLQNNHRRDLAAHATSKRTPSDVRCQLNVQQHQYTRHAIRVISAWLRDLHSKGDLPDGFPLDAVISAMITIMSNNLFECEDMD